MRQRLTTMTVVGLTAVLTTASVLFALVQS